MKEKILKWGLIGVFVVLLALPIIIDANRRGRIQIISFDEFVEVLYESNYAVVYFGDTSVENFDTIRESLHQLREDFDTIDLDIYAVNIFSLTPTERSAIENEIFETGRGYVFIRSRDIVHVEEGIPNLNRLETLIRRYMLDIVLDSEIVYTIPETAAEYLDALRGRNNVVMTVFGTDECPFCRRFEVIFNFLAAEYDFNVFYVNSTRMNSTEHRAIMDSNLMVPAKCVEGDTAIPLAQMPSVPLTLFTRNGVAFDCIRGVATKEVLLEVLHEVGLID